MIPFRCSNEPIAQTINVKYKTTTGNIYPLEFGFNSVESELVPFDFKATTKACQTGCSLYGRNGGCPPSSPVFREICQKYILFFYAKINTKYYPQKVLKGPYYTRWVFVETFMTSLTKKIGKELSSHFGGYFLNSGHCISCKPKRCAVKNGEKCKKPKHRTYSLESTGVIVTELMKTFFNFELQWWDPQNHDYIPAYMVKVVGLTSDKNFGDIELKEVILKILDNKFIENISFF